MMGRIILILATVFITWLFAYEIFYSPKAKVRRLWKEILKLTHEIGEYNDKDSVADSLIREPFEKEVRKREKMINALLDYHFNPEGDQEYIQENRPKN